MSPQVITAKKAKTSGIVDSINNVAATMGVQYLFVSDEAVRTGSGKAASEFNESKPAAIAALFPENAGIVELVEFRQRVAKEIGFVPNIVDICALPNEILDTCVQH